jgi:hypothetical protein
MTPHKEALTDAQWQVLQRLAPDLRQRRVYLGGGTAVALHLGHRRSVDLDWFGENYLGDPMLFAHELTRGGIPLEVKSVQLGTLHGAISGIRISFFDYRYPLLEPLQETGDVNGLIASLLDLAAMKLLAVAQRGTRKDFVDVGALLQQFSLPQMIDGFCRKYAVSDTSRLIYSLSYFDDAEADPMPEMLVDVEWPEVRQTVRQAVAVLARSLGTTD